MCVVLMHPQPPPMAPPPKSYQYLGSVCRRRLGASSQRQLQRGRGRGGTLAPGTGTWWSWLTEKQEKWLCWWRRLQFPGQRGASGDNPARSATWVQVGGRGGPWDSSAGWLQRGRVPPCVHSPPPRLAPSTGGLLSPMCPRAIAFVMGGGVPGSLVHPSTAFL